MTPIEETATESAGVVDTATRQPGGGRDETGTGNHRERRVRHQGIQGKGTWGPTAEKITGCNDHEAMGGGGR